MKITNIKIFKTKKSEPVLAYANIILDNQFIIRGITLLEKGERRYISMPARRLRNNEIRQFRDLCHPLNNEVRKKITDVIFAEYEKLIENEE